MGVLSEVATTDRAPAACALCGVLDKVLLERISYFLSKPVDEVVIHEFISIAFPATHRHIFVHDRVVTLSSIARMSTVVSPTRFSVSVGGDARES